MKGWCLTEDLPVVGGIDGQRIDVVEPLPEFCESASCGRRADNNGMGQQTSCCEGWRTQPRTSLSKVPFLSMASTNRSITLRDLIASEIETESG